MVTFWALGWSLSQSNRAFFSIFVGDALLRLAGLGLFVAVLLSKGIPYTVPLLLVGSAYFLLSVVQVPFFARVR